MLFSLTPLRAKVLGQTLVSTRSFATKTYVVKAAAKTSTASSGSYAPRTRASNRTVISRPAAAATSTATTSSSYAMPKSSTLEPVSDAASSFSPAASIAASSQAFTPTSPDYASSSSSSSSSSPYPGYPEDAAPGASSGTGGQVGGGTNQTPTTAFANNNPLKEVLIGNGAEDGQDWTRSFAGMAVEPFSKEVADVLMRPLQPDDIEIKPDGLLYLPEIKYRRILNQAFGPGGWGLAPRTEHSISPKNISREYALVCHGRFVSIARGEQDYFDIANLATASEGCKSNALMRCCKDLGIASELWDPSFIRQFKKKYCEEVFVEHVVTKRKKKLWKRKDQPDFDYPYSKVK
ncbi:hypothetical protein BGZ94_004436 [Podila epigama]|nr:hypothetical protein BGZ94_004436 [Podila epigama]